MQTGNLALRASLYALLAIGGGIAATAMAQPVEIVTVEAARAVTVGQTSTGVPISEITVRSRVSYADLDLTTDSGVKTLLQRIEAAATSACREMDIRVPSEGSSNEKCIKDAVKGAAPQIAKAVETAKASKK